MNTLTHELFNDALQFQRQVLRHWSEALEAAPPSDSYSDSVSRQSFELLRTMQHCYSVMLESSATASQKMMELQTQMIHDDSPDVSEHLSQIQQASLNILRKTFDQQISELQKMGQASLDLWHEVLRPDEEATSRPAPETAPTS